MKSRENSELSILRIIIKWYWILKMTKWKMILSVGEQRNKLIEINSLSIHFNVLQYSLCFYTVRCIK